MKYVRTIDYKLFEVEDDIEVENAILSSKSLVDVIDCYECDEYGLPTIMSKGLTIDDLLKESRHARKFIDYDFPVYACIYKPIDALHGTNIRVAQLNENGTWEMLINKHESI